MITGQQDAISLSISTILRMYIIGITMRKSRILKKLRTGEVARICCLCNPANAFPAYAAAADFDGIWLDSEHNTWDKREMQGLILLHGVADINCIVRPSTLGKTELYHILEDGATGVLVESRFDEGDDQSRQIKGRDIGGVGRIENGDALDATLR